MVLWRGSVVGVVIIFCWTHMLPPTSTGRMNGVGSGWLSFNHRKLSLSGTMRMTIGEE